MKKVFCFLLSAALLLGMLCAPAMAEDEKIVIGLSLNLQDEINVKFQEIYEQLIAENYPNVELVVTNALGDTSRQLSDVESLIMQDCDVIILRAIDADSGVVCAEAIKNANIYLVLHDTNVNTDIWDVRVMGDQGDHGKAIGKAIKEYLDADEARVVNMGYIHGGTTVTVMRRETGIYDVCGDYVENGRLNTLITGNAAWSADKAMALAEDWLNTYPEINCIAAASDEMAIGVIQALEGAGVNMDEFLVFGVDGTEAGQQYIRSGELDATSYQDIPVAVAKILEVCVGLVNGQTFDKEINPNNYYPMSIDNIDALLGITAE